MTSEIISEYQSQKTNHIRIRSRASGKKHKNVPKCAKKCAKHGRKGPETAKMQEIPPKKHAKLTPNLNKWWTNMKQISFLKNNQRIHKIKTQNNQRMGKKCEKVNKSLKNSRKKRENPKSCWKNFKKKCAKVQNNLPHVPPSQWWQIKTKKNRLSIKKKKEFEKQVCKSSFGTPQGTRCDGAGCWCGGWGRAVSVSAAGVVGLASGWLWGLLFKEHAPELKHPSRV